MCAGSRIYLVNRDQMNAGGHGCDPPWGYIATGYTNHPQSCCRIARDGAVEKVEDDGSVLVVEASPMAVEE